MDYGLWTKKLWSVDCGLWTKNSYSVLLVKVKKPRARPARMKG